MVAVDEENRDKWYYIKEISILSNSRNDIYGTNGLLKLLQETGKINTRQVTSEEARSFWIHMKSK